MAERGWDVLQSAQEIYPRFDYRHDFYAANNVTIQTILKANECVGIMPASIDDCVPAYTNAGSGQAAVRVYTAGAADGTSRRLFADVTGFAPYGCVYLPFGRQDEPPDWFPAPTFRGIKFEVTGGVAASLMSVVLVQDRAY